MVGMGITSVMPFLHLAYASSSYRPNRIEQCSWCCSSYMCVLNYPPLLSLALVPTVNWSAFTPSILTTTSGSRMLAALSPSFFGSLYPDMTWREFRDMQEPSMSLTGAWIYSRKKHSTSRGIVSPLYLHVYHSIWLLVSRAPLCISHACSMYHRIPHTL